MWYSRLARLETPRGESRTTRILAFPGRCERLFRSEPGERWGQFSSLGHDLGVMDVFMALTQGGTLVPLNEAERLRPATAISGRRLSVWQSVSSVIELMFVPNI